MSDIHTLPDALGMIRAVGEITARAAPAGAMARDIDVAFAALPAYEPLAAAYLIWKKPWMAAGTHTFIDDMLARAGLRNVFGGRDRYPRVTLEELRAQAPAVVLLSSEPFPFTGEHVAELAPCVAANARAPGGCDAVLVVRQPAAARAGVLSPRCVAAQMRFRLASSSLT